MIELLNLLPSPVVSFIAFIVTILFLVTIHEFGHFWVARYFKVKIEKFSIGFGKPIIKWYGKKDNTEYSISWIPLGGYVKMHGESIESKKGKNHIPDSKKQQISDFYNSDTVGFIDLPPIKRMAIAFAGPAINLIFAIFAFWLLFVIGVGGIKPVVGSIYDNSIFQTANIESNDTIVKINNRKIETTTDSIISFVDAIGNKNTSVTLLKNNTNQTHMVKLDLSSLGKGSELQIEKSLGFDWKYIDIINKSPAKIRNIIDNSPAKRSGLMAGDKIVQINDQLITTWQEMSQIIRSNPGNELQFEVERDNRIINLTITPEAKENAGKSIGVIGITKFFDPSKINQLKTTKSYGLIGSIPKSIENAYVQSRLLLKTLYRLIIGEASIKNMGGPLTIADISGQTIQIGYEAYFNFLAVISLTLAVMNLLPIPALDGGHILLCTAEIIKGKPLSERTASFLMKIGTTVLLSFMLFVISIDIWKYIGKLF